MSLKPPSLKDESEDGYPSYVEIDKESYSIEDVVIWQCPNCKFGLITEGSIICPKCLKSIKWID